MTIQTSNEIKKVKCPVVGCKYYLNHCIKIANHLMAFHNEFVDGDWSTAYKLARKIHDNIDFEFTPIL